MQKYSNKKIKTGLGELNQNLIFLKINKNEIKISFMLMLHINKPKCYKLK